MQLRDDHGRHGAVQQWPLVASHLGRRSGSKKCSKRRREPPGQLLFALRPTDDPTHSTQCPNSGWATPTKHNDGSSACLGMIGRTSSCDRRKHEPACCHPAQRGVQIESYEKKVPATSSPEFSSLWRVQAIEFATRGKSTAYRAQFGCEGGTRLSEEVKPRRAVLFISEVGWLRQSVARASGVNRPWKRAWSTDADRWF